MSPLLRVQQAYFPRNELFLHIEYVLIRFTKRPSLYVTRIKHQILIMDSNRGDIRVTGVTFRNSVDISP